MKRRTLIVVAILGVAGSIAWFTRDSRPRNPYLDGLVEPVELMDGMSFDDGGSVGLILRDAKGHIFKACLITGEWTRDPVPPAQLALGTYYPDDKHRVPIGGAEERQLMGVLERWTQAHPDARLLRDRYRQLAEGKIDECAFYEGLPGMAGGILNAVYVLDNLKHRNP